MRRRGWGSGWGSGPGRGRSAERRMRSPPSRRAHRSRGARDPTGRPARRSPRARDPASRRAHRHPVRRPPPRPAPRSPPAALPRPTPAHVPRRPRPVSDGKTALLRGLQQGLDLFLGQRFLGDQGGQQLQQTVEGDEVAARGLRSRRRVPQQGPDHQLRVLRVQSGHRTAEVGPAVLLPQCEDHLHGDEQHPARRRPVPHVELGTRHALRREEPVPHVLRDDGLRRPARLAHATDRAPGPVAVGRRPGSAQSRSTPRFAMAVRATSRPRAVKSPLPG